MFIDFDGTLSEIVADPDQARPLEGAPELLARLAGSLGVVAVISGRPVSFLAAQLLEGRPESPLQLFGLYGLERRGGAAPGAPQEALPGPGPELEGLEERLAAAIAELRGQLPPGARLEEKGLSVAVHWRKAPGAAQTLGELAREVAARHGLVPHGGKMSVELLPAVATDKGAVVAELGAGLESACFLGDDLGDLAAFRALARLGRGGTTAVRIAVDGPEVPAALLEEADLVLRGPSGALSFLARLEERLAGGGPRLSP